MNWYDSQACLNLFRINMIWIDTILKHVKTWNENMMKYTKIQQMARGNLHWWQSYSLDRCEQVEQSKMFWEELKTRINSSETSWPLTLPSWTKELRLKDEEGFLSLGCICPFSSFDWELTVVKHSVNFYQNRNIFFYQIYVRIFWGGHQKLAHLALIFETSKHESKNE